MATTTKGDQNNVLMLGAHSDSIRNGPGINDNGSGMAALIEIATQLVGFEHVNAVRFAWFTAEEEGLVGSLAYTQNTSDEDLMKIRLYLNFDMIASENGYLAVYDGDMSIRDANASLPALPDEFRPPKGSEVAEILFRDYFKSRGLPLAEVGRTGNRDDSSSFNEERIPWGGLFTGADEVKTAEQAALFGGEAGKNLDPNYHLASDRLDKINSTLFEYNINAIAHVVATLANSWEGFPPREGKKEVVTKSLVGDQRSRIEKRVVTGMMSSDPPAEDPTSSGEPSLVRRQEDDDEALHRKWKQMCKPRGIDVEICSSRPPTGEKPASGKGDDDDPVLTRIQEKMRKICQSLGNDLYQCPDDARVLNPSRGKVGKFQA